MSLNINLLELELDPLTRVKVYRRSYDSSLSLEEIREQLDTGQFVTRLGDKIWGYLLPESVVEQYEFTEAIHLATALEPPFMNSLLRYAIKQRLEQLGFRRIGFDKFERPGDITFVLGDEGELVARPRWLVRPFSLPSGDSNVFTLLVNPRLAYKFKVNLAQLSREGFKWSDFGDKVRALTAEQASQGNNLWEIAHTALVVEDRGMNRLLCEWRDDEQQEVSLAQCWPLANTENRYRYLKHRYSGLKGEQLAKTMKAKDDDFFALKDVLPRVKNLGELIGWLELGDDLKIQVGDFLELTDVRRKVADELQSSLLLGEPKDVLVEEFVDEAGEDEEDLEEYVQLELF